MKNNKKGFTLIELLVVVAIIGILAAVVLAALQTARNKGADAAAKEDLKNATGQAELYFSANRNSYAGVCSHLGRTHSSSQPVPGIVDMINNAAKAEKLVSYNTFQTGECHNTITAWAASIKLASGVGQYFCVDSNGTAIQTSYSPVFGGGTTCSYTATIYPTDG